MNTPSSAGANLTPAQQSLVQLPTEGQFLVRGAAGSGKSRVALERAFHLARQPLLHGSSRVILFARSPALAAELAKKRDERSSDEKSRDLASRVDITTITRFCAPSGVQSPDESAALVDAAVHLARRRSKSAILGRPLSFFTSEITTILLGLGIETFEQYTPIVREGRGTPLDDESRRTVFSVFTSFRDLSAELGRAAPLACLPSALERLAAGRSRPYDHVVVDDAHLLAPIELKFVRALAAAGSLTLIGALEQKFDPPAANLRELGLDRLDRTSVLPKILRGPAALFQAALALIRRRGADSDLKAILPGSIEGARPRLILCADWRGELAALVAAIDRLKRENRPLRDIAVLGASRAGLALAAGALARAGILAQTIDDETPAATSDAVTLCPLAAAAGREFPLVFVLDVNRGAYPRDRRDLAEHERNAAPDEARRALYLAMTRATEELTLLASEATRSPLVPLKRLTLESFVTPPAG